MQYPTITDFAVEFSTFGETLGISTSGVQTLSLVLELTFKTRLALRSQRTTGLCLLSAGFKKNTVPCLAEKIKFLTT